MSAEVVKFPGVTILPEEPSEVLEKAKGWNLERVLIVGFDKDGAFVFGGSHSEIAESCLLLDIGKRRLLDEADGDD